MGTVTHMPVGHTRRRRQQLKKEQELAQAKWLASGLAGAKRPSHRITDECPSVCHYCPHLRNPDDRFDVLPSCWGTVHHNHLEACLCPDLDGSAS